MHNRPLPARVPGVTAGSRLRRGLTLIECLVAAAVLSVSAAALMLGVSAAHTTIEHADCRARAARLAEQMIEELLPRPITEPGPDRASWCVDQFDGFEEAPGELRDAMGNLVPPADQVFARRTAVEPASIEIAALGGAVVPGRTVTVTITGPQGREWPLTRFLTERALP